MNVSIATVAKDVGTTVTGIQGAITAYTLVMAALMITGAQDRRDHRPQARLRDRLRHLRLRLVHDLDRSEPARAALRLVVPRGHRRGADPARRSSRSSPGTSRSSGGPAAYGLVAAAGAVAVAVGPLIGGFCTTYFSWRWVFAGEVVDRRSRILVPQPPDRRTRRPESARSWTSSARCCPRLGLGLLVFGVLRSAEWGWIQPKPDGPDWCGLSPTIWLDPGRPVRDLGLLPLGDRARGSGEEPLVRPGDAAATSS